MISLVNAYARGNQALAKTAVNGAATPMCCRRSKPCSTRTERGTQPKSSVAKKQRPEKRFLLWFNGNGIPERYWIPTATLVEWQVHS